MKQYEYTQAQKEELLEKVDEILVKVAKPNVSAVFRHSTELSLCPLTFAIRQRAVSYEKARESLAFKMAFVSKEAPKESICKT